MKICRFAENSSHSLEILQTSRNHCKKYRSRPQSREISDEFLRSALERGRRKLEFERRKQPKCNLGIFRVRELWVEREKESRGWGGTRAAGGRGELTGCNRCPLVKNDFENYFGCIALKLGHVPSIDGPECDFEWVSHALGDLSAFWRFKKIK